MFLSKSLKSKYWKTKMKVPVEYYSLLDKKKWPNLIDFSGQDNHFTVEWIFVDKMTLAQGAAVEVRILYELVTAYNM